MFLGITSQQEVSLTVPKQRLPTFTLWIFVIFVCTTLVTIFLASSFIFAVRPQVQVSSFENYPTPVEQNSNLPLPVRLRIEQINVDAVIESVGLAADGALDVPSETENVGWFSTGSYPGEMGSAVITGHFDSEEGIGVFQKLHLLKAGDEITVLDSSGISRTFVVLESRNYDQNEDVPEVFYNNDGRYLNLITCTGAWNNAQKSYEKRLVVFTALKP